MNAFKFASVRLVEDGDRVGHFFGLIARNVLLQLEQNVVIVRDLDEINFLGILIVGSDQLRNYSRLRLAKVINLRRILQRTIKPPLPVAERGVVAYQLVAITKDRRAAGHLVGNDFASTMDRVAVAAQET